MNTHPFVSVIVPCRNERNFIAQCLDSVLSSDYPQQAVEILVVDGMSDDGTREVVARYAREHGHLRLLDNPKRIAPAALNLGIRASRGDVIVRMDAHNWYPRDYVSRLVERLATSGADNVGGVWWTRPGDASARAQAIAFALSHPLGVGNAHFRIGTREPRWVDTVPFGCYRREVFDRIGLFDEELVRNQDDEFNHRLIRHGGRILLDPAVVSHYYARTSLRKLWRMYYQYGYFKPLAARKAGGVFTVRQLVPSFFVSLLLASAGAAPWVATFRVTAAALVVCYVAAIGAVAVSSGVRLGARAAALLFAVFPTLHFSYGLGFLRGMVDFLVLARHRGHEVTAVPISR